jgi:hypothetical protein
MYGSEGLISEAENYLFIDWVVDGDVAYHHPPANRGMTAMTALWYGALKAMADIGTAKENTIFIGDQILTDVWAAHNAGIRAILVPPINDRKDPLTKFKRVLEKPILKKYEKGNNR